MSSRYNDVLMTEEQRPTQNDEESGSWLAELSDAALPSGAPRSADAAQSEDTGGHFPELPAISRTRPQRPPLVPTWVWFALGGAIAVVVLAVAAALTVTSLSRVAVPDVVGESVGAARSRLEQVGLRVTVAERRFSMLPRDQVIEQDPGADTQLQRGDTVRLVISAGSEEFPMPDVVGDGLALARGTLEARGLVVVVEQIVSETTSDTVLSTTPSAGAVVRTGDTVRVQVAVSQTPGVTLQPYRLNGVDVVVDAAPPPAGTGGGTADTTMEVARRLRALLEASGASVTMLRSTGTSSTLDADRAKAAAETSATVAIGFVVASQGDPGRIVSTEGASVTGQESPSADFARQLVTELNRAAPPVEAAEGRSDVVLQSTRAPWARVLLGVVSVRQDENRFADPTWIDSVAQAAYTAIGKTYGTPTSR
jgi:N-acetylmuramoyl-L-alanine amidase